MTTTKHAIIERQRQFIRREGLDALCSSSQENVTYTAGFVVPSMVMGIRSRQFMCVVTADGPDRMVLPDMEEMYARANSRLPDLRAYNEFTEEPADVWAEVFREMGLAEARIGLELDFIPAKHFARLQRNLPKATFVNVEALFGEIRMIKMPEEIEYLRRANFAAEKATHDGLEKLRPGMTELDLAKFIIDSVLSQGIESLSRMVVGSGPRSPFANATPIDRVIEKGDVIRTDIFATMKGYYSDVARTAVVGEPPAEYREIWRKIVEAHRLILDDIRPGARTGEIYKKFRAYFERNGLRPINFVGHGLGLTLHEDPYIGRYGDMELQEGMVLAIEPLIFEPKYGFQLEDEIAVTKDGYELLTNYRGTDELIVVGP